MNRRDIIDWLFAYGHDLDTYSLDEIKEKVRAVEQSKIPPPPYGSAYWPALEAYFGV